MFVRLLARREHQHKGCEIWGSYDANKIICIGDFVEPGNEGCGFVFEAGCEAHNLIAPTYDEAGLVELVMQARLNPNAFLPSNNVGKDKAVELGSTGSHHFSAKDAGK